MVLHQLRNVGDRVGHDRRANPPLTNPDVWRRITVLGLTQTSQPASGPVDSEQETVGP